MSKTRWPYDPKNGRRLVARDWIKDPKTGRTTMRSKLNPARIWDYVAVLCGLGAGACLLTWAAYELFCTIW